jgi:hypothetical protein
MTTDTEWYSGDYWIEWTGGEPPYGQQPPSGEQDHYDIRIADGGVLWLRPRGDDRVMAFAPHQWRYVSFNHVSLAKSGKATFV